MTPAMEVIFVASVGQAPDRATFFPDIDKNGQRVKEDFGEVGRQNDAEPLFFVLNLVLCHFSR